MKQIYSFQLKQLLLLMALTFTYYCSSAQYTVFKTVDDGTLGTLRDAINQVNSGAATTINFDFHLLGPAPYTITLTSDLPAIHPASGTILINGYSEPASFGGLIGNRIISVQINGNAAVTNGLLIFCSNVTVAGLAIYSCDSAEINIRPAMSNIAIKGNFIGTDATGLATGLKTVSTSAGILIGAFGSPTANNAIVVGTDGDGAGDANEGNLVVSNGIGGIVDGGVVAFHTTNSRFSGNIIGLGSDGTTTTNLFNNGTGLLLSDRCTGNIIGTNGDGVSDPLERNYISNNGKNGIWIFSKSDNNIVANNVIGLTSAGNPAANVSFGIDMDNSAGNRVGTNADNTSDALEKNFVSANLAGGIEIIGGNIGGGFDENADNNLIVGNSIGVELDGTTAAGNAGNGIQLRAFTGFSANNTIIGSDGSGTNEAVKGNIIANSPTGSAGISLQDNTNTTLVTGTRISKNSIFNNGTVGVDLVNAGEIAGTGVAPNQDGAGPFPGPNGLLNFPVITSITNDNTNITFNGFAHPGAIVEFYLADKTAVTPAPPTGLAKNFGQGKTFLFQALQGGTLNGITDAGNATGTYTNTDEGTSSGSPVTTDLTFSFAVPAASINLGNSTYTFAASAIDVTNNTSGFGGNMDATFSTLPITLLDFSAHGDNANVYLQWSTGSESNNLRFDIERSANGSSFQKIGEVAGSGNSVTTHDYNFTDNQPLAGVNYYRLRQVDLDNKFTYSKVVIWRSNITDGSIKVFPSTFTDNLNIALNARNGDKLQVLLVDQLGKVVNRYSLSASAGVNSFTLNAGLSNLAPGAYFITITGHTIAYTQKLIKN